MEITPLAAAAMIASAALWAIGLKHLNRIAERRHNREQARIKAVREGLALIRSDRMRKLSVRRYYRENPDLALEQADLNAERVKRDLAEAVINTSGIITGSDDRGGFVEASVHIVDHPVNSTQAGIPA